MFRFNIIYVSIIYLLVVAGCKNPEPKKKAAANKNIACECAPCKKDICLNFVDSETGEKLRNYKIYVENYWEGTVDKSDFIKFPKFSSDSNGIVQFDIKQIPKKINTSFGKLNIYLVHEKFIDWEFRDYHLQKIPIDTCIKIDFLSFVKVKINSSKFNKSTVKEIEIKFLINRIPQLITIHPSRFWKEDLQTFVIRPSDTLDIVNIIYFKDGTLKKSNKRFIYIKHEIQTYFLEL